MNTSPGVLPDCGYHLEQVRREAGRSIISILLEIQKFVVPSNKWIESLECLYVPEIGESRAKRRRVEDGNATQPTKLLSREKLNPLQGERKYIAVSYTWNPVANEDPTAGGYLIEAREDGEDPKPSEVRDVVFSRSLEFAEYKECDYIWIDRECIDQAHVQEQQNAIQSMDLVYSKAEYALALINHSVENEEELEYLSQLLKGEVSEGNEYATLGFLYSIVSDPWWDRAWPYQEDYRAGIRMTYLIPHSEKLEYKKQHVRGPRGGLLLGKLRGEICVKSTDFRTEATKFCLQYMGKFGPSELCQSILKRAGKYNILLRENNDSGELSISKSMSPTIFEDVGRRLICKESDRLAIIANCCAYTTRFDTTALDTNRSSLSLAMLALYLLNGEIIENDKRVGFQALQDSVYGFLHKESLKSFRPPGDEQLTFIKSCRFVDPVFTPVGVKSKGHLWKLGKIFRRGMLGMDEQHPPNLEAFVKEIQKKKHGGPYRDLEGYVTKIYRQKRNPPHLSQQIRSWSWREWMVDQLDEAIRDGKPIRLGSIVPPKVGAADTPYKGIFIGESADDWKDKNAPATYVYTSARPAKEEVIGDLDKFVSLEVDWRGFGSYAVPNVFIKRWINGLAFFEKTPPRHVCFPWPPAFTT